MAQGKQWRGERRAVVIVAADHKAGAEVINRGIARL